MRSNSQNFDVSITSVFTAVSQDADMQQVLVRLNSYRSRRNGIFHGIDALGFSLKDREMW